MRTKRTDFIVGLVITVSIAILIFGIIYLKEYSVGKEVKIVTALFEDVGTLTEGDPVKVNGVKLGKVVRRRLEGVKVLVEMEIDASVAIPADSRVIIQNVGLMGERMIGIRLGASVVPADSKVPLNGEFDSGIAEAMGMLGDVFGDAQDLVLQIKKLMEETVASEEFLRTFRDVTERLDRLTIAVDRMIAGNEQSVNTIIRDMRSTTTDLKGFMDANKGRIDTIMGSASASMEKATVLVKRGDDITRRIDDLLIKINNEDGTVSRLLKDKEFYDYLKSTVREADSLLKTINKTGKIKVKVF